MYNVVLMHSEEVTKRAREGMDGSYQAVGFTYEDKPQEEEAVASVLPVPQQHPPTSSVDIVRDKEDPFIIPEGLAVPTDIKLVRALYGALFGSCMTVSLCVLLE